MTVERGHLWGSGVGRRGEHLHAEGHAAMTEEREYLLLGAMTELIEMKMIWEYSRTRRCTVVCEALGGSYE